MNEFISNLISSLFGTVIGAILAYWIAVKQFKMQKEVEVQHKQVETTLAFYQELISNDFSNARADANELFEKHMATNNSLNNFYSNLPDGKVQSVRSVVSYFRRLQLAVEYKQVDKQIVLDLLSGEFLWWYFMWLDEVIPFEWDTRKNLDKMNNWLQSALPTTQYEQKRKVTLKNKEIRLSELRSNQQA
jgi:uncharacterized membrane-anchored protein YhcB (DUF1043 family)